jgi:hypothetical protein
MPFNIVTTFFPFSKWGFDSLYYFQITFSSLQPMTITTWDEVISLKNVKARQVVSFQQENIFSLLDFPFEIVSDNGGSFCL